MWLFGQVFIEWHKELDKDWLINDKLSNTLMFNERKIAKSNSLTIIKQKNL
jgi:hypothetical protein